MSHTANLLKNLDRRLAAKGITKKVFTVSANGKSGEVLAYNRREARTKIAK